MEIKEAVEYAKEHGLTTLTKEDYRKDVSERMLASVTWKCIEVIEDALDNGYTLCKVDEATEKIKVSENNVVREWIKPKKAIEIIKEACK